MREQVLHPASKQENLRNNSHGVASCSGAGAASSRLIAGQKAGRAPRKNLKEKKDCLANAYSDFLLKEWGRVSNARGEDLETLIPDQNRENYISPAAHSCPFGKKRKGPAPPNRIRTTSRAGFENFHAANSCEKVKSIDMVEQKAKKKAGRARVQKDFAAPMLPARLCFSPVTARTI